MYRSLSMSSTSRQLINSFSRGGRKDNTRNALPRFTSLNNCKQHVIRIRTLKTSIFPDLAEREELKNPIGIMPAQVHCWLQYEEVCSIYHSMVHQH